MNKFFKMLGLVAMGLSVVCAHAGVVAVVGASSPATKITPEQLSAIYTMRMKSLPGAGNVILVVVQETRLELFSAIGKTEDQAHAIWARQVFTGGAMPPTEVTTIAEAKKLLANPNALALIESSTVDSTVKIIWGY